jgi:hypothetical protein
MKISGKVMMMTLAMVLTVAIAYAQPRGGDGQRGGDPTERAKMQTERLTTALELDAKQAEKVEAINLKYAKQQQEMRAAMQKQRETGQEIDRETVGVKMQEMRTAQEEEVKGVLTPTQIEKLDTIKTERGGKGKPQEKGKTQAQGGKKDAATRAKQQTQRMTKALELDAKQAKEAEAINLKYAIQLQEMRGAMQKEDIDKEAMKAKIKSARTAQESEIKGVLTPTQIEKLDAMKTEHKEKAKDRGKKGDKPAKFEKEKIEESGN